MVLKEMVSVAFFEGNKFKIELVQCFVAAILFNINELRILVLKTKVKGPNYTSSELFIHLC